jgi:hypothetical protein
MYCGAALEPKAAPAREAPPPAPEPVKVPCPGCGVGLKVPAAAAGKKLKCPKCGAAVALPVPEPSPADLPFGPGDDLEQAYQKTVAYVRSQGAPLYEPELVNASMHSREFGRQLLLMNRPPGVLYLCVDPWDDEKAALVATDLVGSFKTAMDMGGAPSFMILSLHPVPEPIRFLFGNSPAAQLELLIRSKFDLRAVSSPDQMPDLGTKIGAGLLEKISGSKATLADLRTVGALQQAVLEKLRPEKDPEKPLPEGSYEPEGILLCLGALFGEVLKRRESLDATWVRNDMMPFSIALEVRNRKTGRSIVANPVGKVMKLYQNGREDDLIFFSKYLEEHLSKPAGAGPA